MVALTDTSHSPHARLRSAPLGATRWEGGFWGQRFQQCRAVTLPHLWALADDPARGHALANLRIAAGDQAGEFAGTRWQDEWVHKWIEAASYVFAVTGDRELDARMDEAIDLMARAQAPDGYLATQTQVPGLPRFQQANMHEVYVMGHLLMAACVHHRATGKTSYLDVARKVGDFLFTTFRPPRPPELEHKVFNPSQIMGLVELYRTTGEPRYLEAAGFFVDYHGATPGGSDLMQDRVPLREETQVVGHMVLSTYLYAGATDTYLETGDQSLLAAMDRLWHDLTEKRLYVHGGVAAVHRGHSVRAPEVARRGAARPQPWVQAPQQPDGYPGHLVHRMVDDVHEAAGDDYQLPSATGYNETCAQIGNVLWNWRLLHASADSRHADLIEHTLFNSVLSGIGLDGKSWFYTNPLRWYGPQHKLLSQDAYQRFQPGRVHVCCPSNLLRTVAGLHNYAYSSAEDGDGVYVHLYGASVTVLGGFRLRQETDYPWFGRIVLHVEQAPSGERVIALRVPAWARGAQLAVNGGPPEGVAPGSYGRVQRRWQAGDRLELELPLPVRLVEGHPRIEATRNQAAVLRGPLLYCLESPDLPAGVALDEVYLPPDAALRPRHLDDLLGGLTVLEGELDVMPQPAWNGALYRELERPPAQRRTLRLIPYYAWANRGPSEMTAWLPLSRRA